MYHPFSQSMQRILRLLNFPFWKGVRKLKMMAEHICKIPTTPSVLFWGDAGCFHIKLWLFFFSYYFSFLFVDGDLLLISHIWEVMMAAFALSVKVIHWKLGHFVSTLVMVFTSYCDLDYLVRLGICKGIRKHVYWKSYCSLLLIILLWIIVHFPWFGWENIKPC